VRVEFLDFLRGEIMFKSVEELKKQIKKDISRVL
ncbi:MAG: riboflavin biosynthesis protein RibF, partial [Nitrospiraceae bacterium]|nr:riboflavin biosynthesis protein RibF [Nitrospiraceae bacterium]